MVVRCHRFPRRVEPAGGGARPDQTRSGDGRRRERRASPSVGLELSGDALRPLRRRAFPTVAEEPRARASRRRSAPGDRAPSPTGPDRRRTDRRRRRSGRVIRTGRGRGPGRPHARRRGANRRRRRAERPTVSASSPRNASEASRVSRRGGLRALGIVCARALPPASRPRGLRSPGPAGRARLHPSHTRDPGHDRCR